ncbi:MAG: 30S ribosomal protein S6 [Nitrospiraceae bacterium]|nr:MAG: 30S ribosomal protein S6 [Nitrospiraceae bacterium]
MNYYEKVMIIDPNVDDSAAEDTVGKIREVITKQGGEVLKTENWGRRKLAYELNKHQKGNYIFLLFKAPPAAISELERLCKVTDQVIKFMVVKLTKKKQIEAALSASRSGAKEAVKQSREKTEEAGQPEPAAEEKKDV